MSKRPRSEAFGFAGATIVAAASAIGSLYLLVLMLQASWPVFVVGVIDAGSMLFVGLSEMRQPGVLVGRIQTSPRHPGHGAVLSMADPSRTLAGMSPA